MNNFDQQRRVVLKGAAAASLVGVAASWGFTSQAFAAARPQSAFDAEELDSALNALFGEENVVDASESIIIKAPEIAENGAVVPIKVTANIENVESIALLVPENPAPMVSSYDLQPGAIPEVSMRIKMGKTSDVIALVRANGQVLKGVREVKVTIGGCGG